MHQVNSESSSTRGSAIVALGDHSGCFWRQYSQFAQDELNAISTAGADWSSVRRYV